jgi:uncharacterized membrane protein
LSTLSTRGSFSLILLLDSDIFFVLSLVLVNFRVFRSHVKCEKLSSLFSL